MSLAGYLDLVSGNLDYFNNIGTATMPKFEARTGSSNPFDGIDTEDRGAVALVDLDGDGDLDLAVGCTCSLTFCRSGKTDYFENTGTTTAPKFEAKTGSANPFDGIADSGHPQFADFDGDGDADILVRAGYGKVIYHENVGSAKMPQFVMRLESITVRWH